jgi:hypothetical protein
MKHLRAVAVGTRVPGGCAAPCQSSGFHRPKRPRHLNGGSRHVRSGSTRGAGPVQVEIQLDAGLGAFGFSNSLYTDVRPDPSGDLSDNWFESFIKPAVSGSYASQQAVSCTERSVPSASARWMPRRRWWVRRPSSFEVEDLYIGWRSRDALGTRRERLGLHRGSFSSTRSDKDCSSGTVPARGEPAAASGATHERRGSSPRSALQAEEPHIRALLPGPQRSSGSHNGNPAVGCELRAVAG